MSSTISFVLDGAVVRLDLNHSEHAPTQTLLWYLRSLPHHKDVKEGCAEGDCGACTVAIADLDSHGNVRYRAVDSCLVLLPMINGKCVLTPNSIGTSSQLHPVQQAMVAEDGSQCGYCTPGFVMSLFAMHKNHDSPTRDIVDDALTGNLCRCTGYQSIVNAALSPTAVEALPSALPNETVLAKQLAELPREALNITTATQTYFQPRTLDEALQVRAQHPDARIINGATDVGLLVTKQHQAIPKLLDLSQVDALKHIAETATGWQFGAGASLESVKQIAETAFPALYNMLKVFGSLQIRNLATLGGNLGSASPIGDTPPVLMAYDASIVIQGPQGQRSIKAMDFITGYRQTVLQPDELIVRIDIPTPPASCFVRSYKISKRKDLDISTVSAGFRLELENGTIRAIRLVYGGMAAQTKRASRTEAFLIGKSWSRPNVEAAMALIDEDFTPISDARSGAEARTVMARNLLLKFWSATTS